MKKVFVAATIILAAACGLARSEDDVKPGLIGEYFEFEAGVADFPKIPADKKPTIKRVDKTINVENSEDDFNHTNLSHDFSVRWTGSVKIDKAGKYKFCIESDDGSRLILDGKQVIENGGSHPMQKKECVIELAPGQHELKLDYFQGNGEMGCKFSWAPPGKNEEIVPESVLWHKADAEN